MSPRLKTSPSSPSSAKRKKASLPQCVCERVVSRLAAIRREPGNIHFHKMTPNAIERKSSRSLLVTGALCVSLFLSGCATYHTYRVAGESMLPSLHSGDKIFVDESDEARNDPHDGDIIVLRRNDAVVLKRILAMSGETIGCVNRKVFRNGKQLEEPYLAPPSGQDIPALNTFATRTVGSGELFVMGDNRDLSFDSRAEEYGPVRMSDVVGKYLWTYWHATSVAKKN